MKKSLIIGTCIFSLLNCMEGELVSGPHRGRVEDVKSVDNVYPGWRTQWTPIIPLVNLVAWMGCKKCLDGKLFWGKVILPEELRVEHVCFPEEWLKH